MCRSESGRAQRAFLDFNICSAINAPRGAPRVLRSSKYRRTATTSASTETGEVNESSAGQALRLRTRDYRER